MISVGSSDAGFQARSIKLVRIARVLRLTRLLVSFGITHPAAPSNLYLTTREPNVAAPSQDRKAPIIVGFVVGTAA